MCEYAAENLGKALHQLAGKDCFVMLTAFSGGCSLAENRERNERLGLECKILRFGFYKFRGSFSGEGEAPEVHELLCVYSVPGRQQELKDFTVSSGREFAQEAVLTVGGGTAEVCRA